MGLVAKRIEHEPNSDPAMVVIKSVNPEYQTYQRMSEEVHIIGRARLDVATAVMRPVEPPALGASGRPTPRCLMLEVEYSH
jgi:hypothetical protein